MASHFVRSMRWRRWHSSRSSLVNHPTSRMENWFGFASDYKAARVTYAPWVLRAGARMESRRMRKRRTYLIEVGRPGQGLTDPPFFKVKADTVIFEPDGTIAIRSEKANRRIAPHVWSNSEVALAASSCHAHRTTPEY